jgi:hypothetical protein
MRAQRFLAVLALIFGLAVGCGTTTEPTALAPSTYVLRRVAGDPLPTVLYQNEVLEVRVLSESIHLQSDGTGTISGVQESRLLTSGTPADPPEAVAIPIHYRKQLDHLEIDFDCPPNAICVPPPHLIGALHGSSLQVYWSPGMTGREPLEYVREPAP